MNKRTVIEFFGTERAVADACKVSFQAVNQWPDPIPELRSFQLSLITNGKLKHDPSIYEQAKSHTVEA